MTLEHETDPLRRIPTKHTTSLRAEIGPILRAARLKRGQSLEAVAQQTRISKRFLEALEENRLEQFPAVVYLRGFLKGYCEHLDVNFDEIWGMLNAESTPAAEPAGAPAPAASAPRSWPPAPKPAPHAPAPAQGPGATGALLLAAALAVGLGVYLFKDQGKPTASSAPTAPEALRPMPRAIEPKLVLRLKSDAWLRVAVDGQVVFEGRAPRDAVQEWKPSRFVDLRATEPAVLDISLNGQPVSLGAPGPDGQYRIEIP